MALIAQNSGGDFKQVPAGVHLARCYRIIDLGTQKTEWQGKEKWARKVLIQWELYGEDEEGNKLVTDECKPLSVSKRYTLSLGENAALRADLRAWRGRDFTLEELSGFDINAVLGAPCMLNITHDVKGDKTYTNVAGITPVPKAMRDSVPAGVNKPVIFDLSAPDMELFATFSDRLKENIEASKEWAKVSMNQAAQQGNDSSGSFSDMDSDVPFMQPFHGGLWRSV